MQIAGVGSEGEGEPSIKFFCWSIAAQFFFGMSSEPPSTSSKKRATGIWSLGIFSVGLIAFYLSYLCLMDEGGVVVGLEEHSDRESLWSSWSSSSPPTQVLFKEVDGDSSAINTSDASYKNETTATNATQDYNPNNAPTTQNLNNSNITKSASLIQKSSANSVSKNSSTKYALFSSTLDIKYGFYTPLTSLLWVKMGFTPLVIMVGKSKDLESSLSSSSTSTTVSQTVMEWTRKSGARIQSVLWDDKRDFYDIDTGNGAQLTRLAAGILPVVQQDDDYILLADSDMWPLKKSYFDRTIDYTRAINI